MQQRCGGFFHGAHINFLARKVIRGVIISSGCENAIEMASVVHSMGTQRKLFIACGLSGTFDLSAGSSCLFKKGILWPGNGIRGAAPQTSNLITQRPGNIWRFGECAMVNIFSQSIFLYPMLSNKILKEQKVILLMRSFDQSNVLFMYLIHPSIFLDKP